MKRYMALGAVLVALGAGGTILGQKAAAGGSAAQATGGLSITPAKIVHDSRPGQLATMTVANRSAAPLAVTVTPRPWTQSTSGRVAANRRAKLAGVSVSQSSFTLAPGAAQDVVVTLTSTPPAAGALYGAVEVVGLPTNAATRKGVVLGYRLLGTVRILPAQPKYGLTASALKVSKGTAVLPVRNTGNTLEPVTGTINVKGASGTNNDNLDDIRILPGKQIYVPLGERLARGTYSMTVTLNQHGRKALTVKKKFRVK